MFALMVFIVFCTGTGHKQCQFPEVLKSLTENNYIPNDEERVLWKAGENTSLKLPHPSQPTRKAFVNAVHMRLNRQNLQLFSLSDDGFLAVISQIWQTLPHAVS